MTVLRQRMLDDMRIRDLAGRDADLVSSAGREIRSLLRAISRAARSRGHPDLPVALAR